MLATVMPLFAATAFGPSWWQTLLAAAIGSVFGQVAVRATRGRRVAAWCVAAAAAVIAAVAGSWLLTSADGHADRRDDSPGTVLVVVGSTGGGNSSLTWDDVRAIETRIPSIHLVVPYLRTAVQLVGGGAQNWRTQLVGTTPEFFEVRGLRVVAGHPFDASASANKVVVLGDTVVAQLFGAGASPLGELVRIEGTAFTIIGVLAHRGMSPQGEDLDDVALVPIEVYASRIRGDSRFGGTVLISAVPSSDSSRLEADVHGLLRDRHRLAPGADDDFVIRRSNPE